MMKKLATHLNKFKRGKKKQHDCQFQVYLNEIFIYMHADIKTSENIKLSFSLKNHRNIEKIKKQR